MTVATGEVLTDLRKGHSGTDVLRVFTQIDDTRSGSTKLEESVGSTLALRRTTPPCDWSNTTGDGDRDHQ